jgi:thioredoxin reductase (NADPH)
MSDHIEQLLIIGGGPAAYTAALYASRADLAPLVVEGFGAGGQLMITHEVDNFPGFPQGILGPELMRDMRAQAERFGTRFLTDDVTRVEFSDDPATEPHRIHVGGDVLLARAVIVATGATARQIGLESEVRLQGRGVSYCAVCDAAFFRDRRLVVVGGGDSAMEEATYLAKFASSVVVVHRRQELRASRIMVHRAEANEKITWELGQAVEEVLGEDKLTGVRLRDVETGTLKDIEADGLFVAIGHDPNTSLFRDLLDSDEHGYLVPRDRSSFTNVPGVFLAGDVADRVYRQAITAAGSGCMAALDAERWLAAVLEPA